MAILVINFAIIRIRAPNLQDQLAQAGGAGDEAGALDAKTATSAVEGHLVRFKRGGFDLPSVINIRGFADKDDALDLIQNAERRPGYSEHKRQEYETGSWLMGHFYLGPYAEILADDSLKEYHAATSEAFVYSALTPLGQEDLKRLDEETKKQIIRRNEQLKKLKITGTNTNDNGYTVTDPDYESKRQELLALYQANEAEWKSTTGSALKAMFVETGFVTVMTKLVTFELYSESKREYVHELIGRRWAVTFWLNILATILAWGISIPIGIRSARRKGSLEDTATTNSLFLLWSVPSFFLGTLLLYHFCTDKAGSDGTISKAWFPHAGLSSRDSLWMPSWRYMLDLLWHAALPLIVLTYGSFTALSRYMRGNLLDQFGSDYARTARAKGCSEDRVVYRHCIPNSMITMITLGSGLLSELFGGFLIVEMIWSIPGLGTLMVEAAVTSDAPLLMASTLVSVALLMVSILVADILYAVVDPRIRSRYA